MKQMSLSLSAVHYLCLCIAFSASFPHSGLQRENTEVFIDEVRLDSEAVPHPVQSYIQFSSFVFQEQIIV